MTANDDQQETQPAEPRPPSGDHIETGRINRSAVAIGRGATAVYQGLSYEEVVALFATLKDENQPAVWDGRIPYLGLKAFQESDAAFFFGREELVDDLLQRVSEGNRFIVISGPSGSGKSSVARAGLFHALRAGRVEGSDEWLLATMSPKDNPLEELAKAISRLAGTPAAGDYLREHGRDDPHRPGGEYDPEALHNQAEALLTDNPRQRLVLLVDQFEELFTQTTDAAARESIIRLLTTAAGMTEGRTLIILSLRSDFLSNCALYPDLRAQISKHNQFQLVGAMAPRDLAKAITLPSLEVGAEIDPALVKRIIDDMKGEPGALPLMSFALRDLFMAEKTQKGQPVDLTLEEYVDRGGIEQALERHADKVFARFNSEQRELARGIFSKLITVGEGRLDTRRTAVFEELLPAGADAGSVAAIVGALSAEGVRLVTTSGAGDGQELDAGEIVTSQATVTIAHEKLIDAWPWLRRLIDENRELISLQNQINHDARDWAEEEDPGFLYRGGRLLQVEENMASLEPNLDALSQRFIQASIAEREAEAKAEAERIRQEEALRQEQANAGRFRRLTKWLAVAAVVAVIATLVALFFMNAARGEADLAATSVAEAIAARATSDANALLAATREGEARAAEADANQNARLLATSEAQAREAEAVANESAAVAAASEAEALEAKAEVERLSDSILASRLGESSAVMLDQDQELALRLAAAGLGISEQADTIARFYDASFSPFRRSLEGHAAAVTFAVFDPLGRSVLTASWDGTAKVWDLHGQELAALEGHTDRVTSAAFAPDGEHIATASRDGSAKIWDLASGEMVPLEGHQDGLTSVAFSPDGQRVVTAGEDGSVKVWALDGTELRSLEAYAGEVDSAAFSPDGESVLTVGCDGQGRAFCEAGRVKVWTLDSGELLTFDPHEAGVYSAVFSPSGELILTGGCDVQGRASCEAGSARVWDLGGTEVRAFLGHTARVVSAVFSPDGQSILTASWDDSAKLWSLEGEELATLEGHKDVITSASFRPDGQRIVTAGWDGSARVWDLEGEEVTSLDGHDGWVYSAVFSPDGRHIVTAGQDHTAKLWSPEAEAVASLEGHESGVDSAVFSPDGQRVLTASPDRTAKLWNLLGEELATLEGHTDWLNSALFSPDGQRIVTASHDGTARVWNLAGEELGSFMAHQGEVVSAVFTPDGTRILTAGCDDGTFWCESGSARLWNLMGEELTSVTGYKGAVVSAVLSPSGEVILTAGCDSYDASRGECEAGSARLWNPEDEQLVSLIHSDWVNTAVFSPDGQRILTASSDGNARLWDLDGHEEASLTGHIDEVASAVFSPDGQRIVTASSDFTAKIWDQYGRELASLEGHQSVVNSAEFSPDGQYVVTASNDGSARVWDLEGHELASLEPHFGRVNAATFSPDGQLVLTGDTIGGAKIWEVYPALAGKLVRERLGSEGQAFSEEDCRRFFPADDQESCPRTMEALLALLED